MSTRGDSPQAIWQKKFQSEYSLNPFQSSRESLTYTKLDNPATWWQNPTNHSSLRLTKVAYKMLVDAKAPNYKFTITEKYKPRTFVQLERHFTVPYYLLNAQKIVLFGEESKETMMIALHGNNLQQYLDNLDK